MLALIFGISFWLRFGIRFGIFDPLAFSFRTDIFFYFSVSFFSLLTDSLILKKESKVDSLKSHLLGDRFTQSEHI